MRSRAGYPQPSKFQPAIIRLDTVVSLFLQSFSLDLLMTGKLHQAMIAPLDLVWTRRSYFFCPRRLMGGRARVVPATPAQTYPCYRISFLIPRLTEGRPCWYFHGKSASQ